MSEHPNNLHIATDDAEAKDVGRPEFVTLAGKLSTEHIKAVGDLHKKLYNVRETNLGADQAIELLSDHISALLTVFDAVVPLIQRRLDNYSQGANETKGATSAAAAVRGIIENILGPALQNLNGQLPIVQGFLETVKEATTPPLPVVKAGAPQ